MHQPVLLREVIAALSPKDGAIYIDGTFGGGGYSQAILQAAHCRVLGIDRDPSAIDRAAAMKARFGTRLMLRLGRFSEMEKLAAAEGIAEADGVTLDLGVSSMQLDEADRGFSFRQDGPLDMRMGGVQSGGVTAADLVNRLSEVELAETISELGGDPKARPIARAIVKARAVVPITRTFQLAEIVRQVHGPQRRRAKVGRPGRSSVTIDPATRTFQALRIRVNDELSELRHGLVASERILRPGGRLAVVAFHELEDGYVKRFLRERSGDAPLPSRHLPQSLHPSHPSFRLLSRKSIRPEPDEELRNPRARSAHLRVAERTTAPVLRGDA